MLNWGVFFIKKKLLKYVNEFLAYLLIDNFL